jgi:hypothetical protein
MQRKAVGEGAGAEPGAKASPEIAALMARVAGSAAALRTELQMNPGLAAPIEAACQAGDDHGLGELLARAFPVAKAPVAVAAPAAPVENEKDPADPTLALPAKRADTKDLAKGRMIWDLHAVDHSHARIDVDFVPNAEKVDAKNISFVLTVLNTLGGTPLYPGASKADR